MDFEESYDHNLDYNYFENLSRAFSIFESNLIENQESIKNLNSTEEKQLEIVRLLENFRKAYKEESCPETIVIKDFDPYVTDILIPLPTDSNKLITRNNTIYFIYPELQLGTVLLTNLTMTNLVFDSFGDKQLCFHICSQIVNHIQTSTDIIKANDEFIPSYIKARISDNLEFALEFENAYIEIAKSFVSMFMNIFDTSLSDMHELFSFYQTQASEVGEYSGGNNKRQYALLCKILEINVDK